VSDYLQVRQFAHTRDGDLLEYLASRDISSGFLAEIDQFLRGNPEIATCPEGRNTLTQLSSLPPLQAYRYFLKGYTRPARYVDGVVRTDDFSMPTGFPYRPLAEKHDPELLEFFDGFDYRHDVIDRRVPAHLACFAQARLLCCLGQSGGRLQMVRVLVPK
jgi:hypothetical protein